MEALSQQAHPDGESLFLHAADHFQIILHGGGQLVPTGPFVSLQCIEPFISQIESIIFMIYILVCNQSPPPAIHYE